jgi:predicted nucleic acid-binding protein
MVVIDATMLMLLLRPGVSGPSDSNGAPITKARERVGLLVDQLQKAKSKIIIPAPALSEVLVRAGTAASQQIIEGINRFAAFRIEPFDVRAAIEVATMTRDALSGKGKKGGSAATWAKIKYDRQIVAIAKVCGAGVIYSDDSDIRSIAKAAGIKVVGLAELPMPPEDPQQNLPLESAKGVRAIDLQPDEPEPAS